MFLIGTRAARQIPDKPNSKYHSENQLALWNAVRDYFESEGMSWNSDSYGVDLAHTTLTLFVEIFWDLSPYKLYLLESKNMSKANAMPQVLVQFFEFKKLYSSIPEGEGFDVPPPTSETTGHKAHEKPPPLTVETLQKVSNKIITILKPAIWKQNSCFLKVAEVLSKLLAAIHTRIQLNFAGSGRKAIARSSDAAKCREFTDAGTIKLINPRDDFSSPTDLEYGLLDSVLADMEIYSFGSLTDKYIFAEQAEKKKFAFQQKEGISTVGYKRRKWLDQLPGKLSFRIEEIDWSTGNQGTLRFFIKLPNPPEEVDSVKMLGTQQQILASIPKYALNKSIAYARDLFDTLLPSANKGVRSKLIRLLTNDNRSPEGNAKSVQMRLDDFFATGTVYVLSTYLYMQPCL